MEGGVKTWLGRVFASLGVRKILGVKENGDVLRISVFITKSEKVPDL